MVANDERLSGQPVMDMRDTLIIVGVMLAAVLIAIAIIMLDV